MDNSKITLSGLWWLDGNDIIFCINLKNNSLKYTINLIDNNLNMLYQSRQINLADNFIFIDRFKYSTKPLYILAYISINNKKNILKYSEHAPKQFNSLLTSKLKSSLSFTDIIISSNSILTDIVKSAIIEVRGMLDSL